jgi:type II secretory pathway pseudopilin PulG
MLMVLVFMMALIAIAAATAITSITFNLRRDREEEMIHRGAQYARAIRAYYKKFGRYPATIENLENTNQMRFLRKRYKDPITHKDFRLLHFGEVKMAMSGLGGGTIPGASTVNANGTLSNAANPTSNTSQNNENGTQPSDSNTGTDSQNTSSDSGNNSGDLTSSSGSGQTFGGLPIVGVASTSKEETIREFNKKKKYNEWQFAYDPTMDRGILISTPYQPQQIFGMAAQNVNGPQQPVVTPGLGTGAPGAPAAPTSPAPPTGSPQGNPNQPTDTPNQQ